MYTSHLKHSLAVGAAVLVLGTAGLGAAAPADEGSVQIPNPIVSYGTYGSAARVLGFCPLTLSRDSGYALDGISVIGGRASDLAFVRMGQPDSRVRIRTALKKDNKNNNLSRIYGTEWKKQRVNETEVELAQISPQSYAATWETGNYVFAVLGEGMEPAAFRTLLTNSLVEDTEHYFASIQKNPEKSGKKTVYSTL